LRAPTRLLGDDAPNGTAHSLALIQLAQIALFAGAYFGAGLVSQWLTVLPGLSANFWMPPGVFLGVLLRSEIRRWPGFTAGGFAAELAASMGLYGLPLGTSAGVGLANTSEALAAAALIRFWIEGPVGLRTMRELLAFLTGGILLAPMLGATIGAATMELSGRSAFLQTWPLWWVGDAAGVLLAAPATIGVLRAIADWRFIARARWLEAAAMLAATLGVAHVIFSGQTPLGFMALPVLIWAALRFGVPGAAAATLVLGIIAVRYTAAGSGMFSAIDDPDRRAIVVQLFMGIMGVSALVLAALTDQWRVALTALQRARGELEGHVAERTAAAETSEARLRSLVEQSIAGIAETDKNGRYTLVNDTFCEIVGWSRAELLERRMHDITHPADLPANARQFLDLVEGRIPSYEVEKRNFRRDGTEVWVRDRVAPARWPDGSLRAVVAVSYDVTAQKRIEQELRESEERLRQAALVARLGIFERNFRTGEAYWSPAMREILGADPEEAATFQTYVDRIHPADRQRIVEGTKKRDDPAVAAVAAYEYRIVRPDGTICWVSARSRTIFEGDADRRPVLTIGAVVDITEQKKWSEHQKVLLQELSHRVKNTLAVVQAIMNQTVRAGTDPLSFAKAIEGRIMSLAASHTLLTREEWRGASLSEIVRSQLRPLTGLSEDALALDGSEVLLAPEIATRLGLIVHELGTNAAKHGALSVPGGKVRVAWTIGDRFLTLSWTERGGPAPKGASRQGFGMKLLAMSGRNVRASFDPEGFSCELELSLESADPRPS
jgi:PAS domain S-box-containing protein